MPCRSPSERPRTTTPLRGDRLTTCQRRGPPALGEHSREVLAELGYDAATVGALCEAGAVDAADWAPADGPVPRAAPLN